MRALLTYFQWSNMRSTQERHSFEDTVLKSRGRYCEFCIEESGTKLGLTIAEWNEAIFGDTIKPKRPKNISAHVEVTSEIVGDRYASSLLNSRDKMYEALRQRGFSDIQISKAIDSSDQRDLDAHDIDLVEGIIQSQDHIVMHSDPANKNNRFISDQKKIYDQMLMGDNDNGQASSVTLTLPKTITIAAYYPLTNARTFVRLHAGMNYDDIVTCLCTR